MNKKKVSIAFLLIISSVFITSCATNEFADDPLETVEELDIGRYLGRWYEIARFQSGFEKKLVGVTAEYTLREDGRVQVVNSGFKNDLDGKYTSVKAIAWRPNDSIPGALKVKFFRLFTGDYMVFGLDQDNYEWALVGNNSRDFLWFLSRTPEIKPELIDKMKEMAIAQGYDLSELFFVPQKKRE